MNDAEVVITGRENPERGLQTPPLQPASRFSARDQKRNSEYAAALIGKKAGKKTKVGDKQIGNPNGSLSEEITLQGS